MDTERELVHSGLLATKVIDADLGVGDTATEAGLGVWLVLTVAVATGRAATHLEQWRSRTASGGRKTMFGLVLVRFFFLIKGIEFNKNIYGKKLKFLFKFLVSYKTTFQVLGINLYVLSTQGNGLKFLIIFFKQFLKSWLMKRALTLVISTRTAFFCSV